MQCARFKPSSVNVNIVPDIDEGEELDSGVPQGCVLGPAITLAYNNKIRKRLNNIHFFITNLALVHNMFTR